MNRLLSRLAALALCALALSACDDKQPASSAPVQTPAIALPPNLFAGGPPAEKPLGIAHAITSAKDGDNILIIGAVGGRKEPFVPNRAAVLLTDLSIPSCLVEGDNCATPWDFCCTPKEKLQGHIALIQVVDASGQPLKTPLSDAGGIAPLKTLLVQGAVRREKDSNTLTINANSIYVQP